MKTQSLRKEDSQHDWYIVDASNKVLGRLATKLADKLRGKDKSTFTPHVDGGDYVVVINAEKVKVTGNKFNNKMYHYHSGYIGNLKSIPFKDLIEKNPEEVIQKAVKGMLPKGPLGREMVRKMKVFAGSEHTHAAQQPQLLDI